jgi:hypothetical protein
METTMKYFKGSFLFSILAIVSGYLLAGWPGAWAVFVLSILETSLSFDNAVVNATVLKDMDDVWKHRFLTWGMIIAVFGMRVVFPMLIVSVTSHMYPIDNPLAYLGFAGFEHVPNVLDLAVNHPSRYEEALKGSHISIAGFGGAFLFMVCLEFFIDNEKGVHWLAALEAPLSTLAKYDAIHILITLGAAYGFSIFLPEATGHTFFYSAVAGIAAHSLATWIGVLLESEHDGDEQPTSVNVPVVVAKAGLASFLYLELLDASFSFDGVIGAFALSDNIFIIALGLGAGAFFVRSLTLMFVDKGTLDQFRYLEHGAFYAIAALAAIMFAGTIIEISETVTGLLGAGFIGLALISSILYNRKMEAQTA